MPSEEEVRRAAAAAKSRAEERRARKREKRAAEDEQADKFLEALKSAMNRELKTETVGRSVQVESCRPHQEAFEASELDFEDFVRLLRRPTFKRRYVKIMGPPPPLKQLTLLWLVGFDSHVELAKKGHASSVTFLLKHLDERFKPKPKGRPASKKAEGAKSLKSTPEKRKQADAMYASLLSGEPN